MGPMRNMRLLMLPAVIPGAFSALCTPLACSSVHVFLIRGTNEPYPGRQLPTAEAICKDWDCSWSNIEYPAVFNDYCESAETGIANLGKAVTDYATRCPDSKIVLSGHSQGGQVVGDYLGGGGGNATSCTQETSQGISPGTFPADHIIAALMFGSPRHNANQSYNLLVGARATSAWPREGEQLQALNLWSDKLRDYCNLDDPACAGGSNWTAHENYFELYKDDSAQFVRFKACK
ncbi:hypothetical protein J7T55_002111 [Diaporthe amygdali]|uniref:uncharacterized protein n=1 Tax=Phomopsis amygdali TaxID=1214568 RepID=UPI0022FF0877|nr:uncharacterized protein J7T55_002111 [Diaporthe amygdali]KAJ0108507.1 hypothetical protein J7T55_002111 [Diaporthe amygdali]